MEKFLFTIEDTFQIQKLGLVVVVSIAEKDSAVSMGDEIELRRKDGSSILTRIASIPINCPYNPERPLSFALPKEITKEDVPVGTDIYEHKVSN